MPSCCTRRSSSQKRSSTSFGSPLPLITRLPSSTPSRDAAVQPHRRGPGESRAEQVERGIGRDQLHQRGRVHRRAARATRRGAVAPTSCTTTTIASGGTLRTVAAPARPRPAAPRAAGRRAASATACRHERRGECIAGRSCGDVARLHFFLSSPLQRRPTRRWRARCSPSKPRPSAWRGVGVGAGAWSHEEDGGAKASARVAAGGIAAAGAGRHHRARARRGRLRPRAGRLHRPAHRLLGGAGTGVRRGQPGAADRQPARRRRRRARARWRTHRLCGSRWTRAWTRSTRRAMRMTDAVGTRSARRRCTRRPCNAAAGASGAARAVAGYALAASASGSHRRGRCAGRAAPWPSALARGLARAPGRAAKRSMRAQALPLYLRDKVALTTAERDARRPRRRLERACSAGARRGTRPARPWLRPMTVGVLDAVLAIEQAAYEFPWTRGNFIDSLAAGYWRAVAARPPAAMLGYFVAMQASTRCTCSTSPSRPRSRGAAMPAHARRAGGACRGRAARAAVAGGAHEQQRARAIYGRYGFRGVGVRTRLLPGRGRPREDAW